jgi:hypothetical protein
LSSSSPGWSRSPSLPDGRRSTSPVPGATTTNSATGRVDAVIVVTASGEKPGQFAPVYRADPAVGGSSGFPQ